MINFIKTTCFLALITAFAACNFQPRPIPIDIEEAEQKLVISSFALPPQEVLVTVSRTFGALLSQGDSIDIENPEIEDLILVDSAEVLLSYNGRTVELVKLQPGLYGSADVERIIGEKYVLTIKDFDTGLTARAETTILPQITLDTVYTVTQILPSLGDTSKTFHLGFTDPAGTEDYFLATYTNVTNLSREVLLPGQSFFSVNRDQFNVFTDKNNGDGQKIEFEPKSLFQVGDTVAVGLAIIPKEYYDFMNSYKKSGNLLSQIVSEPVNLPSNVENGYGYFTLIIPNFKFVNIQ